MTLYQCATQLPLDSPAIGTGTCGALASYFGDFGAKAEASPAAARSAAAAVANGAASGYCPPNPRSSRQRALADGITASVLSSAPGQPACTVRWAEGKWYVDLVGNIGPGQWEPAADQVVAYLKNTHLLPPVRGVMSVDLAGDGEHTTLAWPEGSDLYFAGDYHDAVAAAALAVSSTALG